MDTPYIVALCPTYKRPEQLANALACWQQQNYPRDRRLLLICDDALQFDAQSGLDGSWTLAQHSPRFPTLPEKYNWLARYARILFEPDIFAVWEDDDVFLPHHLSSIAEKFRPGVRQFFVSDLVWSNYQQPFGVLQLEGAAGRMHSSWAYSSSLFAHVGGYPDTDRLDFDQQMDRTCRAAGEIATYGTEQFPSYVYRWGSGPYNGSGVGEDRWPEFWKQLGEQPAPFVGELVPRMDTETSMIYANLLATEEPKSAIF